MTNKSAPVHVPPLVLGDAYEIARFEELDGTNFAFRLFGTRCSREIATAVARWLCAALAQTHPDRTPRMHAMGPATGAPCSHQRCMPLPDDEGAVCMICGATLLRDDAAPTGAEGAE